MTSNGSFKELHDNVTSALLNTTRTAGQIASEDLSFLRTSNPKLAKALDKQNARLLRLAKDLTRNASAGTDVNAPDLTSADAVDDEWRHVVDVVDNLFEKADICLDEYTGIIKHQTRSGNETIESSSKTGRPSRAAQSQHIVKPQLFFKNSPKNNDRTAFKPLLRTKPNAIEPLQETINPAPGEVKTQEWPHPYETEIKQSKYPPSAYVSAPPTPPRPFEATTATYVDTLDGVHEMLSELKSAREIAIDLEHHDLRTYVGLVSLMQISTRDRDWIVDTLKPWREELQILNEVFTDPSIVKVLHGAYMDIVWLQRDLGLYVVGLFDTFHAVSALGYPKRSLAYLLKKLVDFDAQKQFQLADWRIRPLSHDMFEYARSDTHFLLYIFDNIRNELINNSNEYGNLVDKVLDASQEVALQTYQRPIYDEEMGMGSGGWFDMVVRQSGVYNKEQFAVFKAVHQWRDEVARKEDESVNYILQNNSLYTVAREMPSESAQLLGCIAHVSDPVRKRISELLGVIKRAKIRGSNGLDMKDALRQHPANIEHEARKAQRKKERQEAQAAKQLTVGEIIRRENLNVSTDELKSAASAFWGLTLVDARPLKPALFDDSMACSFAVPLPTLDIADDLDSVEAAPKESQPIASLESARHLDTDSANGAPAVDETFIINEKNGTRKRRASDQDPDQDRTEADEIKLKSEATEPSPKKQKRNKKQAKIEARKARRDSEGKISKESSSGDVNEAFQPDSDQEDPFDYSTAPSVLHAKSAAPNKKQAPAFDPYKKAMNAPKGLCRARRETAGKSATFKS